MTMPKQTLMTILLESATGVTGAAIYMIVKQIRYKLLTAIIYMFVGAIGSIVGYSVYTQFYGTNEYQLAINFFCGFIAYPFFQGLSKSAGKLSEGPHVLLDLIKPWLKK